MWPFGIWTRGSGYKEIPNPKRLGLQGNDHGDHSPEIRAAQNGEILSHEMERVRKLLSFF